MLTGVIYGAIVVVWAAYLVPLALRRHDEATRSRSIARFSSAMRVLARRGANGATLVPPNARVVLTPKAKESGPVGPEAPAPAQVLVRPRRDRAAEREAAARRRRVLSILLGLTSVVVLVSLVGLLPRWTFVVPVIAILAFLVIARLSVRRAQEGVWVPAPSASGESSTVVVRRPAVRVDASRLLDDDEPTITLTAAQRRQAAVAQPAAPAEPVAPPVEPAAPRVHQPVAAQVSTGSTLWDPLPVTLPTYVGAPAAKRSFRTIALGEPGTWSSGHSTPDSQTVAAAASGSGSGSSAVSVTSPAATTAAADEPSEAAVARAVNG